MTTDHTPPEDVDDQPDDPDPDASTLIVWHVATPTTGRSLVGGDLIVVLVLTAVLGLVIGVVVLVDHFA